MAWIARDSDVHLFIYAQKPLRGDFQWNPKRDNFGIESDMIEIPSGADEKLIGRHITWEDEPIEI